MKVEFLKVVRILDEALAEKPGEGEDLTEARRRAESDALPEDIVSFNVRMLKVFDADISDDPRFQGTRPIQTDDGQLVGFFVMKAGGYAKVFFARDVKPFGLYFGSGTSFYLTIQISTDRKHPYGKACLVVSEVPLNGTSVKVTV